MQNVEGPGRRNAQAAALSHCEVLHAGVRAQDFARGADKLAGFAYFTGRGNSLDFAAGDEFARFFLLPLGRSDLSFASLWR